MIVVVQPLHFYWILMSISTYQISEKCLHRIVKKLDLCTKLAKKNSIMINMIKIFVSIGSSGAATGMDEIYDN